MAESELLSQAIGLIYDAALDPRLWPMALESVRDFIGGSAANFFWQDVSKQNAGTFYCVGIEKSYLESYFAEFAKIEKITIMSEIARVICLGNSVSSLFRAIVILILLYQVKVFRSEKKCK